MQECEGTYRTSLMINTLLCLLPQNFSLCETQYNLINWTERHNLGMLLPTNRSVGRTAVTYKTSPYIQNLSWSLLTAKRREGKRWTWKRPSWWEEHLEEYSLQRIYSYSVRSYASRFSFKINNQDDNKSPLIECLLGVMPCVAFYTHNLI